MKNILLGLMIILLFSGCFANKPKCNDESVKSVLKEILDSDEWIYVEYGLNEQSLRALLISFKGMGFRELEAALATDTLGVLKHYFKPMFAIKEYANEVVYTNFSDFITEDSDSKNSTYCKATLTITYPQMPEEMFKRYKNGVLDGALFKGGDVEKTIQYSARYTDDSKKIYVELF